MSETKWKVDIQDKSNTADTNRREGMQFEDVKQKIKRIHKKKSGPVKQIFGTFQNIYEKGGQGLSQDTSVKPTTPILQGSELEGFTVDPSGGSGTAANSFSNISEDIKSNVNNLGQKLAGTGTTLNTLKSEISQLLDEMRDMNSSSLMYYGDLGSNMPPQVDMGAFEANLANTLKNNRVIEAAKTAITSVATILKLIMKQFIAKLTLAYKTLQYFMLNIENYMQQFITAIANGLTNNTATDIEISIFQDQTQKFCSILLIWMFIYNWYYIVFFLDDRDNIRWKFNADLMEKNNPILYFLFGPSVRVLQCINWLIVDCCGKATKYISKPFIFFIMFFIFSVLVASNYQMTMITDFFNCFDHNFGNSIWVIFVIIIVGAYTLKYLWDNVWIFAGRSIVLMIVGLIVSVLYIIYSITINLPIGVIFLTTYFFLYSFLGIFIYEGFGAFGILPAISEDISFIHADLKAGDICLEPPDFSFSKIPSYIYKYSKKFIDIISAYMFEIVVLFILFTGILTYIKNFNMAAMQKASFNSASDVASPVRSAFSQLFTWLILINIVIIILIVLFTVQKYHTINKIKGKTDLKEDLQDRAGYEETQRRGVEAKEGLRLYKENTSAKDRLATLRNSFKNEIEEPDFSSASPKGRVYATVKTSKPVDQGEIDNLARTYGDGNEIIRFKDDEHIELDLMSFKVGVVTRSSLEKQLIEDGILTPKGFLTRNLGQATTISEAYKAPTRSLNKKMGQGLTAIGNNSRTNRLVTLETKYKNTIIRPDAKDLERSKEGPLFVSVEPIEPMDETRQQQLEELIQNHSSVIEMDDNNPGYIKVDILNMDKPLETQLNELGVLQRKGTLETVFGKAGSNVQNTPARPRVEIERDLEDEEEVKTVAGSEEPEQEPEQRERQR